MHVCNLPQPSANHLINLSQAFCKCTLPTKHAIDPGHASPQSSCREVLRNRGPHAAERHLIKGWGRICLQPKFSSCTMSARRLSPRQAFVLFSLCNLIVFNFISALKTMALSSSEILSPAHALSVLSYCETRLREIMSQKKKSCLDITINEVKLFFFWRETGVGA